MGVKIRERCREMSIYKKRLSQILTCGISMHVRDVSHCPAPRRSTFSNFSHLTSVRSPAGCVRILIFGLARGIYRKSARISFVILLTEAILHLGTAATATNHVSSAIELFLTHRHHSLYASHHSPHRIPWR